MVHARQAASAAACRDDLMDPYDAADIQPSPVSADRREPRSVLANHLARNAT